jgi:hypothetical protein
MNKKIERLTAEQEAYLPRFREQWLDRGVATGPCDRDRTETAVKKLYAAKNIPAPKIVIWMDSPLGGCFAAGVLKQLPAAKDQLRDQLQGQLGDQLRGQLQGQLGGQLWGQLRDQLWGQLWGQLRGQLRDQLWGQLRGQLRDQLRDQLLGQLLVQLVGQLWGQLRDQLWGQLWGQLRGQLRDQLNQCGFGQHDASWVAWLRFGQHIGASLTPAYAMDGFDGLSDAGWWWPFGGVVVFTDRPARLVRDERGRMSSEDGPAIRYQDGWQLWYLRGVAVDEQIVMRPETQTIQQIRGEKNEEVKRLRIERWGWPQYLTGINAKRIHARRNDIEGTRESLYRADGHCVLVCACPSTAKVFALEVPANVETCDGAQSYLSSGLNSRIISAA